MMVRHIASHTSMKESGPEASAPTPFTGAPLGRKRREVVADAAALLHGQRRLAQMREDAAHVVGDRPHDEAVEQRHAALGAGAGDDAAGRQELEILEGGVEAAGPAAPGRARPAATALAMRRHVSSRVLSTAAPSAPLKRYFMSQMRWDMAATGFISSTWGSDGGARKSKGPVTAGQVHVPVMFPHPLFG